MAHNAGEEYLITHIALGFNDEPLTDADAVSVKITIYEVVEDAEPVALGSVTDQELTWNPTPAWSIRVANRPVSGQGWWQYLWDTDGIDPGTYKARVTLEGVTGGKNFETLRIRLKRDPLAS